MTADLAGHVAGATVGLLRLGAAELWLSTIVCLIVWVAVRLLRGRWLAFEHALWALVLLRLLLPPSLAHPLGLGSLVRALAGETVSLAGDDASGLPTSGTSLAATRLAATPNAAVAPWVLGLAACWGLGLAALLARDLRLRRRCTGLVRHSAPVDAADVVRRVEGWRRRLGIRRTVRVLVTDAALVPFTVGVRRPAIVLPRILLERAGPLGVQTALAHELAHVARWDDLWLGLQRLVSRLYFFHPVVWLTSRRLHAGRESLADALVVSTGLMTRRDYARGFVDVLQLDLQGVGAPSLFTTERRITMRLRTILRMGALRRPRGLAALATAALVGAFLLPLAAASNVGTTRAATPASPPAPLAVSLSSPLPGARLSAGFGPMNHPFTHKRQNHTGVDLVAPLETAVLAAADGVVETATTTYESLKAAGTVVVVDHGNDVKTFYSHLGALLVQPGQRVRRSEPLARVGLTGTTTGPHLHFEVWRHGRQVDPAAAVASLGESPKVTQP